MRNRLIPISFVSSVAILTVVYVVYYFLFDDHFMHISINAILTRSHELSMKQHLIVLGLIPIYIALMVSGAALLGIYLGSAIQSCFNRSLKKSVKN